MSDVEQPSPKYFVEIGGERYGPADFETLKAWISEGRLSPSTPLIEEGTERRLAASELEGLFQPGAFSGPPPIAGQAWRDPMAPPGGAPRRGFPVWGIVLAVLGGCAVLCCPIMAAILFPVFSQARYAAQKTVGLSHMKQLGLATLIYCNDYDGRFPPDMSSALAAKPVLLPYVPRGSTAMTDGPDILFVTKNPAGGSILGDSRLSGKNSDDVRSPATAVMFYDEKPWPQGEGMACYVDGHARTEPTFDSIAQALATAPIPPKGGDSIHL